MKRLSVMLLCGALFTGQVAAHEVWVKDFDFSELDCDQLVIEYRIADGKRLSAELKAFIPSASKAEEEQFRLFLTTTAALDKEFRKKRCG